jgi:DNA polymerase-3 subunit beta
MNLTIERKTLSLALKQASRVASKSSTLPILSCVALHAMRGALGVRATNLDVSVELRLETPDVPEEGAVAVCCSRLSAAVDRLSGAVISLTLVKGKLHVHGEGLDEVRLSVLGVEEFPEAPAVKKGTEFSCELGGLASAVGRVMHAVSDDATRYALNGVFFDGEEGRLVATDGRRLAACELGQLDDCVSAVVPGDALRVVMVMAAEGKVRVRFGAQNVLFDGGKWSVVAKLIDATFPKYQQVIPERSGKVLKVSKARMLSALSVAAVMLDGKSEAVRLVAVNDGTALRLESAQAEVGESEALVPAECAPVFRAAFNFRYLREMLEALREDEVCIDMRDETSPARIESGDFTAVLMPLRIS